MSTARRGSRSKLPPRLKPCVFPVRLKIRASVASGAHQFYGSVTGDCQSPVFRQGGGSDVPGANDVGVLLVAARLAPELGLAPAIGAFAMTTLRTRLAGIPRVHLDHGHPCH